MPNMYKPVVEASESFQEDPSEDSLLRNVTAKGKLMNNTNEYCACEIYNLCIRKNRRWWVCTPGTSQDEVYFCNIASDKPLVEVLVSVVWSLKDSSSADFFLCFVTSRQEDLSSEEKGSCVVSQMCNTDVCCCMHKTKYLLGKFSHQLDLKTPLRVSFFVM